MKRNTKKKHLTDRERHPSIVFSNFKKKQPCPRCHRLMHLGVCLDGCLMCQSCFQNLHGLAPLPSDSL